MSTIRFTENPEALSNGRAGGETLRSGETGRGAARGPGLDCVFRPPREVPAAGDDPAAYCSECGAAVAGGEFCPECGATLRVKSTCPQCRAAIRAGVRLCPACGCRMQ